MSSLAQVSFFFQAEDGIRDVAVTGVQTCALPISISELASKPLRIEERVKKSDDGAGGVMDQTVKFPLWFDPYWKGGTPMCAALKEATGIVETWCQEHPKGFPPIVINITDGEATDGDLVAEARKLTAVSGEDGSVLL